VERELIGLAFEISKPGFFTFGVEKDLEKRENFLHFWEFSQTRANLNLLKNHEVIKKTISGTQFAEYRGFFSFH